MSHSSEPGLEVGGRGRREIANSWGGRKGKETSRGGTQGCHLVLTSPADRYLNHQVQKPLKVQAESRLPGLTHYQTRGWAHQEKRLNEAGSSLVGSLPIPRPLWAPLAQLWFSWRQQEPDRAPCNQNPAKLQQ